jgi:hypothetical protein
VLGKVEPNDLGKDAPHLCFVQPRGFCYQNIFTTTWKSAEEARGLIVVCSSIDSSHWKWGSLLTEGGGSNL